MNTQQFCHNTSIATTKKELPMTPPYADSIAALRTFPQLLETAIANLDEACMTAHPLVGEWSIAQNVHHLADSHMNAYIRCRLSPVRTIRPSNPTTKMPGHLAIVKPPMSPLHWQFSKAYTSVGQIFLQISQQATGSEWAIIQTSAQ
jgi:hypothetical protein